MNINRINLNLLIAFDALLSELNVTLAGQKIFITQSAMSSALAQLRALLNDPLLIREGKAMRPTPRALQLAPVIKKILQEIEHAIVPTSFNAKSSDKIFRIGMSDYAEFVLLPKLLPLLSKEAPHVRLKIIHLNALDKKAPFEEQQLDLGIGVAFEKIAESLESELLFTDGIACVARNQHPLMQKKLTLQKYLKAKHMVIIFPEEAYRSCIDNTLAKLGLKRDAMVSVPHMIPGLFALANTPLILTTTTIIANTIAKALKLSMQAPPFKTERVEIKQAWQKHNIADPAHHWLRELVKQAANKLHD